MSDEIGDIASALSRLASDRGNGQAFELLPPEIVSMMKGIMKLKNAGVASAFEIVARLGLLFEKEKKRRQ